MTDSQRVMATVRTFLKGQKKDDDVALDTSLFADGIGLDSLQTAELSVVLEDELGRDPFSEGVVVQRVADLVNFYEDKS